MIAVVVFRLFGMAVVVVVAIIAGLLPIADVVAAGDVSEPAIGLPNFLTLREHSIPSTIGIRSGLSVLAHYAHGPALQRKARNGELAQDAVRPVPGAAMVKARMRVGGKRSQPRVTLSRSIRPPGAGHTMPRGGLAQFGTTDWGAGARRSPARV